MSSTTPARTTAQEHPASPGEPGGRTVIADTVIAKIIGIAVRDVKGVHALGGIAGRALGAIRGAVGSADLAQGVDVEVGETQVAADITLVTEYPVRLQKLAEDVRASAARAIGDLVGMEVAEINVTIDDVHLPSDDEGREQEEARVR